MRGDTSPGVLIARENSREDNGSRWKAAQWKMRYCSRACDKVFARSRFSRFFEVDSETEIIAFIIAFTSRSRFFISLQIREYTQYHFLLKLHEQQWKIIVNFGLEKIAFVQLNGVDISNSSGISSWWLGYWSCFVCFHVNAIVYGGIVYRLAYFANCGPLERNSDLAETETNLAEITDARCHCLWQYRTP